jgi:photosystem II stability/assembly factor-like uncharacterized protein
LRTLRSPRLILRLALPALVLAALAWPAAAASRSARAADSAAIDPALLAGLKARSIGPAAMSGRVPAIAVVESNPDVVYVGAAAGGVWKSEDAGLTWAPIFDDQPVHSIGAIAVFQANPDVVWVGTGEGNPRNTASIGDGVYRSLDGGRTWQHLGLDATERIARIVLSPSDPAVAYVAALGREWGENPERGIYKTSDGGRTWKRVLYVDERSGGAELVMDPANPNKLFAALWDYRRWPWFFRSGGPGSGLYVSYDGGESWKRLSEDDGLPKGVLGRIGVAVAPSDPRIVYATVETAAKNALVRSEDGGKSWRSVNTEPRVTERPFYYSAIHVDPLLPNRIYSLTSRLQVSNDGGKTFERLGRSNDIHGDYHAMWINPRDPNVLIAGEDGGVGISRDRGNTWQFVSNLPLGQYYHVKVDMDTPYHVYGGLQDNGSWRGPSSVWSFRGGIRNQEWNVVGGGDGFMVLSDPADSMAGYSESQGGNSIRWNLRTSENRFIKPPEVSIDPAKRLRFNWNAGLAQDPFDAGTIYAGSQFVHKSTDRGDSWTIISPDLTTNNPEWQKQAQTGGLTLDVSAAENYCSILAIEPSTVERGLIWVGTDDGRVHVTRDGGKSWSSVEANIPGVPEHTWVPEIRASRLAAGTAFVVFDDHRRSNWKPYVYRTDDYGKSWKSLATPELRGYALAIDQDPVDANLLFLGTEFGLYFSPDAGAHWSKWKYGLPAAASVMDVMVHPRDHDLVIATHGRALFVVDDITPLREMSAATLREPLHVYSIAPALQHGSHQPAGANGAGSGEYNGDNRPYGALITYSLNLPGLPLADDKKERERKEAERAAAKAAASGKAPAAGTSSASAAGAGAGGGGEENVPANQPQAGQPPQEPPREAEEEEPAAAGERGRPKEPEVDIRISDASGKTLRTLHGPARLGVNRAVWDFGRDAFKQPPGTERGGFRFRESGPEVLPGTYSVVVKYRGHESKGTVRVLPNPSSHAGEADLQANEAMVRRAGELNNALVEAVTRLEAAKADIDVALAKLRRAEAQEKEKREAQGGSAGMAGGRDEDDDKAAATPKNTAATRTNAPMRVPAAGDAARPARKESANQALIRAGRDLQKKLADAERKIAVPPNGKGIVDDRTALAKVGGVRQRIEGAWARPSASAASELEQAEAMVKAALEEVNRLLAADVADYQRQLAAAKIELLAPGAPIEVGSAH